MNRWIAILLLACSIFIEGENTGATEAKPVAQASSSRFAYVDIYVDTKSESLAAYQFNFSADQGHMTVVGIEGGEHAAFSKNPPYYDLHAIGQNRVILAAFSTANDLPHGKTRMARIHLMIEGDPPHYTLKLDVAANAAGKEISGVITFIEGATP